MLGQKKFGTMMDPVMMAPDVGGAGDGGAGGGGSDEDKPLTRREVTEMLNKTVTGAMKNWEGRLTKDLDGRLAAFGEQLVEKIGKTAPATDPAANKGTPAASGNVSPEVEQVMKELAKEKEARAEQEKRLKAIEDGKRKAEKDLEDNTFTGALRDALAKAGGTGIRPLMMTSALALHRASGRFFVKDGQVFGKVQKAGYEDEVPADEAISIWLRTDEGKQFLPPVDVGGAGDQRLHSSGGRIDGDGAGLTSKDASSRTAAAFSILSTPRD